ncbi:MAG: PilW family protein [Candidatus Methylomirabilales bacterium]
MREQVSTRWRDEQGFTVAEVLMASVLVVIIFIPLYTLFMAGNRTFNTGVDRAEIQQNARVALQSMTREIRMAGYEFPGLFNPACPSPKAAACVLPTRLASKIGLRAEVDGIDDLDGPTRTEEVEYELRNCINQICELARRERDWDDATSTWGAWSAYETIAGNVEGLTFTYLPALNPTRVRIQVNVREPNAGPDVAYMVVSDMVLRNL